MPFACLLLTLHLLLTNVKNAQQSKACIEESHRIRYQQTLFGQTQNRNKDT